MTRRWGVIAFLQALLTKTIFIALLIVDVLSLILFGRQLPAVTYPFVLVLGILIASYQVYSDLNKQIDSLNSSFLSLEGEPPRLELSPKSAEFGGHGWQNRMPMPPLRFLVTLDMRNLSDHQATLHEIRVSRITTSSGLIADHSSRLSVYPTGVPRRGQSVPLPLVIPPHEWNPNLLCEIEVELVEKDRRSSLAVSPS